MRRDWRRLVAAARLIVVALIPLHDLVQAKTSGRVTRRPWLRGEWLQPRMLKDFLGRWSVLRFLLEKVYYEVLGWLWDILPALDLIQIQLLIYNIIDELVIIFWIERDVITQKYMEYNT